MSDIEREPIKIDIFKESLHFSCAHFTIFSHEYRENLHGHNYRVRASVWSEIGSSGLCFDYNQLKILLQELCDQLDETTLLPAQSPFLKYEETDNSWVVTFNDEVMTFLKRDVFMIEIRNVTVEELTQWFLKRLLQDSRFKQLPINRMSLSILSGPSESASVCWTPQ